MPSFRLFVGQRILLYSVVSVFKWRAGLQKSLRLQQATTYYDKYLQFKVKMGIQENVVLIFSRNLKGKRNFVSHRFVKLKWKRYEAKQQKVVTKANFAKQHNLFCKTAKFVSQPVSQNSKRNEFRRKPYLKVSLMWPSRYFRRCSGVAGQNRIQKLVPCRLKNQCFPE